MFNWRKHSTAPEAFMTLQLVTVLLGAHLKSPKTTVFFALLFAAVSAAGWIISYRRVRHIADTPTSKIASAAQGYVEFFGHTAQHPGHKVLSKYGNRQCVWYRYRVHDTSRKNAIVESGLSHDSFLIRDRTGMCTVYPEGAEVVTDHKREWKVGKLLYVERYIYEADQLYALGEFATLRNADVDYDLNAEVSDRLREMKANKPLLLKRFDKNGDGEIDLKEWELARREAVTEALKTRQEALAQPGIPVMRKPSGRRLYLLATRHPKQLQFRYRAWALFHFVALIASAAIAAYVALTPRM